MDDDPDYRLPALNRRASWTLGGLVVLGTVTALVAVVVACAFAGSWLVPRLLDWLVAAA